MNISEIFKMEKLHSMEDTIKNPSYIDNSPNEWKSRKFLEIAEQYRLIEPFQRTLQREAETPEEHLNIKGETIKDFILRAYKNSNWSFEYYHDTDTFHGTFRHFLYGEEVDREDFSGKGYAEYLSILRELELNTMGNREKNKQVDGFIQEIILQDCVPFLSYYDIYKDGRTYLYPLFIFQK